MKIMELNSKVFDNFAKGVSFNNYYQTSMYGNALKSLGYSISYYGLLDNNHNIISGCLLIFNTKKTKLGSLTSAYCPKGFLIDYNNEELLKVFVKNLKKVLRKRNCTYLRIDPPLLNIDNDYINRDKVNLDKLLFNHLGYNKKLETFIPRFNLVINLSNINNEEALFNQLTDNEKQVIRNSNIYGFEIFKGNLTDIDNIYNCTNIYEDSINYYNSLTFEFSKTNSLDINLIKINPLVYLDNTKNLYEKELDNNNIYVSKLVSNDIENRNEILNKKMQSDVLLEQYKKQMIIASEYVKNNPNGITIGGIVSIRYNDKVYILLEGIMDEYKNTNGLIYLKYNVIKNYYKSGFKSIDLGYVTEDITSNSEYYKQYLHKNFLNAVQHVYVGEYDLPIKSTKYFIFRNIRSLTKYLYKDNK